MKSAVTDITDPATLRALRNLAESRERLTDWLDSTPSIAGRLARGTLGSVLSFAMPRLPWMRWGLSALLLLRTLRRRRR
jgi:hypothetical protein